jgi:cell division protein FtsN
MAENRKGKDKRYYFNFGQLVLLGGAFTLASIVIFFLGIFVGKEIESRKMVKPEEPLVKVPVKSSAGAAAAPGPQAKEELTFYDTLKRSPAPQSAENKREKSAKAEVRANKPETKNDAPAGKLIDRKAAAAPDARNASGAKETAEHKATDKPWSVQVNAYPDERSAKQLVDRLKTKGYNAVVTEVQNNGKTWYRVRVGRYASREDADKAVDVLKGKENFANAFAAR